MWPFYVRMRLPRWDVAALPHDGAEREPEAIEHSEVVGEARPVNAILDLPLVRAEATDEKQAETDAEVGENNVHPYLEGERVHKGEYPRFLFVWLLDHDAYAETHVRLREVNDPLSYRRYRQWRYGEVRLL